MNKKLICSLRTIVDDIENIGASPLTVDTIAVDVLKQAIAALHPQPAELAEQQGDVLLPCPFCGESAERIDFGPGAGDNEGGSCVACTGCGTSGPVEFGFKENFRSIWNRRALAATGKQQVGDIPTMDTGLAAWLTARGLMPDADEDGCLEMDDVIAALNEHERQLAPEQQVGEVQRDGLAAMDRLVAHIESLGPSQIHPDYVQDARTARAAIAARQPVGNDGFAEAMRDARREVYNNEPHVVATLGWLERRAARYASQPVGPNDCACIYYGLGKAPYICERHRNAAPPAQAVDLRQLRPMVQMYIEANEKIEHLSDVAAWAVGHGKRLLAKIDGRDAGTGDA